MPVIGTAITENEKQRIDRLVEKGLFINRSDFLRSAIREFLEGFSIDTSDKRSKEGDE